MIIDNFVRDDQNEVWAICGDEKVHLDSAYIATYKPQIGDEIAQEEPEDTVEAIAEPVPEVVEEVQVAEVIQMPLVAEEVVDEEPK